MYNPRGRIDARALTFPCASGDVDFAILTSVFTHIRIEGIANYLRELSRVVRPGGRVFATFFLIGEVRRGALRQGGQRITFDPHSPGPEYLTDPQRPSATVGIAQSWLLETAARVGLVPHIPVAYGHWCGGVEASFQDMVVFKRIGSRA